MTNQAIMVGLLCSLWLPDRVLGAYHNGSVPTTTAAKLPIFVLTCAISTSMIAEPYVSSASQHLWATAAHRGLIQSSNSTELQMNQLRPNAQNT